MRTGDLDTASQRYKYHSKVGWRLIFARLLLGHLEQTASPGDYDLIVAAPTYTGPPEYRDPHTQAVLTAAAAEDLPGRWPFDTHDPPALIAIGPQPRSAGGGYAAKAEAAARLAGTVAVPRPERVAGRRLLLYDDVFTTGQTLNALAHALRRAGAAEVSAVVLARAPWRD
jgi:predicted amidophosphoribosyltransferase